MAALTAAAIPAQGASAALTSALYAGTVTDLDGDPDSYAVTVRITAAPLRVGRTAGWVSYRAEEDEQSGEASLSCQGTLSYRGRRGRVLRFRETIAGGAGAACVTGGTVTLTPRGARRLSYRWSKAGQDRPNPTATLSR